MTSIGKCGSATAVLVAATLTGCTSVKSTYLHRNDADSRWARNHIKGIPVTLEVPTHVRFSVFETMYTVNQTVAGASTMTPDEVQAARAARDKATKDAEEAKGAYDLAVTIYTAAAKASAAKPDDTALKSTAESTAKDAADKKVVSDKATADLATAQAKLDTPPSTTQMQLVMLDANQPLKTYNVTYDFITEKKIFGVDFKRPAAGPFSLTANFKNQYFTDVDHRLTDQTIEKVGTAINNLIGQLVPTGGLPRGKPQVAGSGVDSTPVALESLVCSEVFRIDAPDFELLVADFLRRYCCELQTLHGPANPVGAGGSAPASAPSPPPPADGAPFTPSSPRQDVSISAPGVVRASITPPTAKPTVVSRPVIPPRAGFEAAPPLPAGL
jgi:hypothetical protein